MDLHSQRLSRQMPRLFTSQKGHPMTPLSDEEIVELEAYARAWQMMPSWSHDIARTIDIPRLLATIAALKKENEQLRKAKELDNTMINGVAGYAQAARLAGLERAAEIAQSYDIYYGRPLTPSEVIKPIIAAIRAEGRRE
jgi:hypothetical protein